MAWTGVADKARSGAAGLARKAWRCTSSQARRQRPGEHGGARRSRPGLLAQGTARCGSAGVLRLPNGSRMGVRMGPLIPSHSLFPEQMDFIKAEPEYVFRIEDGEESMGVDAQTAGSELDRIRRRDGTIRPAAVVDEARPEDAPLHPAFEWRDPVAAEQWREHQASTLIRVVRVVPAAPQEPRVASVRPVTQAAAPVVERYDPMAREVQEAVGLVVEARRKIEELKLRTQRMGDRKSMVVLGVAFGMLDEAHEALTNCQVSSTWERELQRAR